MKKLLLCLMLTCSMNVFSNVSQKDVALFSAINLMDLEAVKEALANGADANAIDEYRQTALHYAAKNGNADIVQLLLESNANVNAEGFYSQTPLHDAAQNGYTDIARLLLENNANVDMEPESHPTKTSSTKKIIIGTSLLVTAAALACAPELIANACFDTSFYYRIKKSEYMGTPTMCRGFMHGEHTTKIAQWPRIIMIAVPTFLAAASGIYLLGKSIYEKYHTNT